MKFVGQFVEYNVFFLRHIYPHYFLTYTIFPEISAIGHYTGRSFYFQQFQNQTGHNKQFVYSLPIHYILQNIPQQTLHLTPKDISLRVFSVLYITCRYHHPKPLKTQFLTAFLFYSDVVVSSNALIFISVFLITANWFKVYGNIHTITHSHALKHTTPIS